MASPVLPPNPCLIGIVLVIKSRKGANTVFHYPPHPGEDTPLRDALDTKLNRDYDTDLPTTSSDDSDSNSSSSDTPRRTKDAPHTRRRVHNAREQELAADPCVDEEGSSSPDKGDGPGQGDKQMLGGNGPLFGSMGLTQLLAPARTFHKKKFEMSLDGLVYLGWPVFVREDGFWQKKKKKKVRKQTLASEVSEETVGLRALGVGTEEGKMIGPSRNDDEGGLASGADAGTEDPADEDGQAAVPDSDATPSASDLNAGEDKGGTSTESKKETTGTTAATTGLTMFNVVFLLNPPPFEHHQRVTDMYDHIVKKFSRALKWEQARSGYVWEQSQLILKMTRKAHLNETPPSTLHPLILAASPLASAISTLFASISTSRIATISLHSHSSHLSLQIPLPTSPLSQLTPHHALLLLSPLPTGTTPLPPALTAYLHTSTPYRTFAQTALSTHTPLPTILHLASHLMHHRRAVAIPPLHHRNTYLPAPTAPLHTLPTATRDYARRFSPALPSLPCLLAKLSAQPGPYARFVPSKDHKAAYLEVLAWLVAGGWVQRVGTGLWVRVPGWVVADAAKAAEAEAKPAGDAAHHESDPPTPSSSSGSAHTAIPPAAPSPQPTLILHPLRPSAEASVQLTRISAHILRTQGRESQEAWERCVKYFDGAHAVEGIAVREGWKRGRVEGWVEGWRREGVLVGGRWL